MYKTDIKIPKINIYTPYYENIISYCIIFAIFFALLGIANSHSMPFHEECSNFLSSISSFLNLQPDIHKDHSEIINYITSSFVSYSIILVTVEKIFRMLIYKNVEFSEILEDLYTFLTKFSSMLCVLFMFYFLFKSNINIIKPLGETILCNFIYLIWTKNKNHTNDLKITFHSQNKLPIMQHNNIVSAKLTIRDLETTKVYTPCNYKISISYLGNNQAIIEIYPLLPSPHPNM